MTRLQLVQSMRLISMAAVLGFITACQTVPQAPEVPDTPLNNAQQEIPESELLDVGIHVLDSGSINDKEREQGISEDIRNAEARFVAIHLRDNHSANRSLGCGEGGSGTIRNRGSDCGRTNRRIEWGVPETDH